MQGYVDIHHHIFYGVDDGPRSLEESRAMLHIAYQEGTRYIIGTPHFDPMGHCPNLNLLYRELEELQNYCDVMLPGMELFLGSEILYRDNAYKHLVAGEIPTLASSNYVLVEFFLDTKKDRIEDAIRKLASYGYRTVIAHTERFKDLATDREYIQYLKQKYQTLIQVNAEVFVDRQPFYVRRFIRHGMNEGLIDFVASDAHGIKWRRNKLSEALAKVEEKYHIEDFGQELSFDTFLYS